MRRASQRATIALWVRWEAAAPCLKLHMIGNRLRPPTQPVPMPLSAPSCPPAFLPTPRLAAILHALHGAAPARRRPDRLGKVCLPAAAGWRQLSRWPAARAQRTSACCSETRTAVFLCVQGLQSSCCMGQRARQGFLAVPAPPPVSKVLLQPARALRPPALQQYLQANLTPKQLGQLREAWQRFQQGCQAAQQRRNNATSGLHCAAALQSVSWQKQSMLPSGGCTAERSQVRQRLCEAHLAQSSTQSSLGASWHTLAEAVQAFCSMAEN